jgi:1,4-dihydroxy-2-naphthoate octaprenyltransferase
MFILQYALIVVLVITGFFTPVMLLVLAAAVNLPRVWRVFSEPYPKERPADYPAEAWPTYFAATAFFHNRHYGLILIGALLIDSILKVTGVM